MVDATLAALADLPADARDTAHLAFVTHSIPDTMNDGSGPDGGAYVAQHRSRHGRGRRAGPPGDRAPARARAGLLLALRLAADPVARAGRQRPPRGAARRRACRASCMVPIGFVSDHMEVVYDLDTEALATAEKLGLPATRAATAGIDPRFVAVGPRPAARAGRRRARRGRRPRGRGLVAGLLGPLPGRLLPQPAGRATGAVPGRLVTASHRELADLALVGGPRCRGARSANGLAAT